MQAPTLTKKQQNKALSGKKRKKVKITNILESPFSNYWYALSDEENNAILEILQSHLPKVKKDKVVVPYKAIKKIQKNHRKQFREDYNDCTLTINKSESDGLVFGVNAVTKLLEQNNVGCLILSYDIEPRFMVKHVIDQSILLNCPFVLVKNVRKTIQTKSGINSCCLALKRQFNPKLAIIYETVSTISERYPVPQNHINYLRKLTDNTEMERKLCELSTVEMKQGENDGKNYHLIRQSKGRVFVPPANQTFKTDVREEKKRKMVECEEGQYKNLIVKRVKNNPNREKTKMEMFKTKS